MIDVRVAETDEDLEAWREVRLAVLPHEPAMTVGEMRAAKTPEQLRLLAYLEGRLAGSGFADRSLNAERAFVAPRVLPDQRRRGVGSALLRDLAEFALGLGVDRAVAHVEDGDAGALAFALRFGFEEVDRQVEQRRAVGAEPPPPPLPDGIEVRTIADHPELLREAYDLAAAQGYADMATQWPVSVSLDEWLREEATYPEASFVALADGEIVGFAGLCRWQDDDERATHGLTVVRRDWRGRQLAAALKRRQLAWAAANGIREIVTWTQRGNENMQRVNERLGYVLHRATLTMLGPLPLRPR